MTATVIHGNALNLAACGIADESVDLIVTSPPYFGLRSYQDGGEHYAGQIGAEATPAEFVDALIAATREMVRVLKPSGSIFVNLGDSAVKKCYQDLPHRYSIAVVDRLGLWKRAEIVWNKPNGLPESVKDRVRRSHETWFHFTKRARYYANVDTIREPHITPPEVLARLVSVKSDPDGHNTSAKTGGQHKMGTEHPLGKLPGSVWSINTTPLRVPKDLGVQHFAAFPMEWPRRFIKGWCPPGICTACGQGRRSVPADTALDMSRPQARRAHELATAAGLGEEHYRALLSVGVSDTGRGAATQTGTGKNAAATVALADEARAVLGGYAREYLLRRPTGFTQVCRCAAPLVPVTVEEVDLQTGHLVTRTVERPDPTWVNSAPTRPAVVLDPFGGTGTTATVAHAFGRHGITVDLSRDYCRVAEWRTTDPGQLAKARQEPKPKVTVTVPTEQGDA